MNIFACDPDSAVAAQALPDKLVVKMPLETAQILCTALWNAGQEAPYLPTHRKHPSVLWAGETAGNWNWLVAHGLALCEEFTRRYGKVHASREIILQVAKRGPRKGKLQPFAMAMPEQYKQADPVMAYRHFMIAEKAHYATWKAPSTPPHWWKNEVDSATREPKITKSVSSSTRSEQRRLKQSAT